MPLYGTVHAYERALERHAVTLNEADMQACVMAIIDAVDGQRGRALLLYTWPRHDTEIWWVKLGGQEMQVAYNPVEARIITVLPPNAHRSAPTRPPRR